MVYIYIYIYILYIYTSIYVQQIYICSARRVLHVAQCDISVYICATHCACVSPRVCTHIHTHTHTHTHPHTHTHMTIPPLLMMSGHTSTPITTVSRECHYHNKTGILHMPAQCPVPALQPASPALIGIISRRV